jgi:hypothetical protein
MRMLMTVQIPTESGNKSIAEGSLPKVIGDFIEKAKPEAAYFTTENGNRTAIFVVDLKSASDIPMLAEPFFMALNARIDFRATMNLEELRTGLSRLG